MPSVTWERYGKSIVTSAAGTSALTAKSSGSSDDYRNLCAAALIFSTVDY